MTRTADVVRMSGDEYGRLMDEREILRQEASRAWREVDFIAKERTEHLEWRTKLANDLDECERMRDALRAALELYRGQVDQTGRHSAAEAIERAVAGQLELGVGRLEPERVRRAVWVYVGFRHLALKAEDGELLAEVRGTHPPGVYEYQGKRYHGEQEAKAAAMRALGAS